jgi:hypothetical protein
MSDTVCTCTWAFGAGPDSDCPTHGQFQGEARFDVGEGGEVTPTVEPLTQWNARRLAHEAVLHLSPGACERCGLPANVAPPVLSPDELRLALSSALPLLPSDAAIERAGERCAEIGEIAQSDITAFIAGGRWVREFSLSPPIRDNDESGKRLPETDDGEALSDRSFDEWFADYPVPKEYEPSNLKPYWFAKQAWREARKRAFEEKPPDPLRGAHACLGNPVCQVPGHPWVKSK